MVMPRWIGRWERSEFRSQMLDLRCQILGVRCQISDVRSQMYGFCIEQIIYGDVVLTCYHIT